MATKAGQFANQIENKTADLEAVRATRAFVLTTDAEPEPLAAIDDFGNLVLQTSNIPKKDAIALAEFITDQFTPLP